jgi:hypothetical protein
VQGFWSAVELGPNALCNWRAPREVATSLAPGDDPGP